MNWILRYSDKFDYHTNLKAVLAPIIDDLDGFNWLLADLEYMYWDKGNLPINMDDDYFILSATQFRQVVEANMQMIWGILLGIPSDCSIVVDEDNLPYVEGNPVVWKNSNLQHPEARIEIVSFDSSYTMVKFKDEVLSDKFRAYFPEAVELEKFKNKSAPHY
ncbi:hypothetical protein [Mucilaginibacter sp.]